MSISLRVPYINQSEKWPTGCESVSAVMFLRYLGIPISVDEFIGYLPKQDFEIREGIRYGGDPNECFIGSPYDPDSFGCYAPVMCRTLDRVLEAYGSPLRTIDLTGVPLEELEQDYLEQKMPVLFWATIDLKPSRPGPVWKIGDRDFQWISNEHCMLYTGWHENTSIFNDPWQNHGVIAYDRELIRIRHAEMRSMAVSVR